MGMSMEDLQKRKEELFQRVFGSVTQEHLYHYTWPCCAERISSTGVFYATRKDQFKDSELLYPAELLQGVAETLDMRDEAEKLLNDWSKGCVVGFDHENLATYVRENIPYSLSFCTDYPCDYLLDNFGIGCLAVETASINDNLRVGTATESTSWHYGYVIYDKQEQNDILKEWLQLWNDVLDNMPSTPGQDYIDLQNEVQTFLIGTLDMIKDPKYAPEREVKYVCSDSAGLQEVPFHGKASVRITGLAFKRVQ